jgi:hypothetical protein
MSRERVQETATTASPPQPPVRRFTTIGLAAPGDTSNTAASTYKENLSIGLNLKLTGAGPATTIIDGGLVPRTFIIADKTAHVMLSKLTVQNVGSLCRGGRLRVIC